MNKACPICAGAARKGLVLVEYKFNGAEKQMQIGRYDFNVRAPRVFVRPADLQLVLSNPRVERVIP